ncbi:MAG: hypothetical protein ABNH21_06720 [Glaciecola sp.]|jgi:hypothetical protein
MEQETTSILAQWLDIEPKVRIAYITVFVGAILGLLGMFQRNHIHKSKFALDEKVFAREKLEVLYESVCSHHRETLSDISKMVKPQSIDSVIEKMEKPISSIDKAEVLVNLYQPQIKKELDDLFEATDSLLSHLRKIRKNAPMTLLSFLDTEQYKTYIKKLHICKIKIKDVSRSLSI